MNTKQRGFTLIELIIVIVILGILAVTAAPKFLDISRDAKIASLNAIAGSMKSTINLVEMKARVTGLRKLTSNPRSGQSNYVIDFGFAKTEIDWRNLCPESRSEMNDRTNFFEFMNIDVDGKMTTVVNNQYSLIGYDIPQNRSRTRGCYIIYDSFGSPSCTVTVVDVDC